MTDVLHLRTPEKRRPGKRLRAAQVDLVLLAVAAVWGGSYLAAKDVTLVTTVPVLLAGRFLLTALAMLPVCLATRVGRPSRDELWIGVLFGGTQAAILVLETYGVAHTSATNAGLIISLTVIITPLLESVARRNWLPAPFFAAAAVAVLGVALLVSSAGFRALDVGDLLMLGAALVRSVHVTLLARSTADRPVRTTAVTTVQSATCAVLFTLAAGPGLLPALSGLSATAWGGLTFLAVACGAFAFLAQLWGIRRTSASRASLLMGTEPVWAVAVGLLIGGESLRPLGILGAILIVTATYYGQRIESRHRTQRPCE